MLTCLAHIDVFSLTPSANRSLRTPCASVSAREHEPLLLTYSLCPRKAATTAMERPWGYSLHHPSVAGTFNTNHGECDERTRSSSRLAH